MTRIPTLSAACAAFTFALSQPALAKETVLIVPEQPTEGAAAFSRLVKQSFDDLNQGDNLMVINVGKAKPIVTIEVPDDPVMGLEKQRNRALSRERSILRRYVQEQLMGDPVSYQEITSDFIGSLRALGDIRAGRDDPANVLMVVKPLVEDSERPELSMLSLDGTVSIPTSGYLLGDMLDSKFGLGRDTDYLEGSTIHICAILPKVTAHEFDQVKTFTAHYIDLRGGVLATFSSNVDICIKRYQDGVSEPVEVHPLNPNTPAAMVAAEMSGPVISVTINSQQRIEDQLQMERKESKRILSTKDREIAQCEIKARKWDQLKPQSPASESKTVSTFEHVPHPTLSEINVSTGVTFDYEAFPSYQTAWCHFDIHNDKGSPVYVKVGEKKPRRRIEWSMPSAMVLQDVGLSTSDIITARKACRFPKS